MKTINDLKTNKQALIYNDLVIAFQKHYTDNKKYLRLGQAFYNFFSGSLYYGPKPDLFYTKNNHEAKKIMENDLVTYVIEKYNEKNT